MNSTVLCLSGWAQPHDALVTVAPDALHLPYADAGSEAQALSYIADNAGNCNIAVGWSLGGWLLMRAATEGLLPACKHMVILGSPVQFVASKEFPHAMGCQTFQQFYDNFHADPLRTAKRFSHLIVKGDAYYEAIFPTLPFYEEETVLRQWSWGLDVLAEQKITDLNYHSLPSLTVIHGQKDAIVHPEQGKFLTDNAVGADYYSLPECAHAPHLHQPELVISVIQAVLKQL